MTTVKQIESAVKHLPEEMLVVFRKWFEEFDASRWDAQFEDDALKGRLDGPANQALKSLKTGRCSAL